MKIAFIAIIIMAGSLPLSAQTLVPKTEPTENTVITQKEISAKAATTQARRKPTAETTTDANHFRSKRVIQTQGTVFITKGQSFTFTAGDSIVLNPGFEVDSTTEFTAEIMALPVETASAPEVAAASAKAPEVVENAGSLKAFSLYPNPASEQFHIQYAVNKTAVVSLALFTLDGTPVQHFVKAQQQEPGNYKLTLPVDKIPSGVYVVLLKISNQTLSQRIILR